MNKETLNPNFSLEKFAYKAALDIFDVKGCILKNYGAGAFCNSPIKSQNNWKVFKVYSDTGYTGANFDRSGVNYKENFLKPA